MNHTSGYIEPELKPEDLFVDGFATKYSKFFMDINTNRSVYCLSSPHFELLFPKTVNTTQGITIIFSDLYWDTCEEDISNVSRIRFCDMKETCMQENGNSHAPILYISRAPFKIPPFYEGGTYVISGLLVFLIILCASKKGNGQKFQDDKKSTKN